MIEFHGKTLETFKAGLHTHSTVSDGQFPPQEVIRRYADHGYRALALTDHRKTHPVGCYDSCGMTLIPGIEIHPQGPRGIPWHLLSLGVPEGFPAEYASGQEAVDAVNAAGGIVFEAHPYWCGFTAAELMTLKGVCGIEVYNTSTRYIGKAYNMQIWDELLDAGCRCSALAVDDMHRSCDLFRGWTVICAENSEPDSLLDALRTGSFYSSQGPELYRIRCEGAIFEAAFSPCVEAILMTSKSNGFCGCVPDEAGPGSPAREVTEVHFDLRGCNPQNYLRLQLRDRNGCCAWSMPLYL